MSGLRERSLGDGPAPSAIAPDGTTAYVTNSLPARSTLIETATSPAGTAITELKERPPRPGSAPERYGVRHRPVLTASGADRASARTRTV
jgi:DNA-binding beta-propeller fold protein YncE